MTRTKSIRYNAAQDESLLIQSGKLFFQNCKGNWRSQYFKNNNPIILELACGRGEYTVGLSQIFPNKNFIGIDIKGERMMMGIKKWKQEQEEKGVTNHKPNIAFLRTIIHHIDHFFAPGEIDEIWIVHPDPRSKGHDERRRITSPRFLTMYEKILQSDGILRLKTDDDGMYEYTRDQLAIFKSETGIQFNLLDETYDLDNSELLHEHYGIETHYGKLFKAEGRTIKYGIWKK